jgi:hypothetical protein
MTICTIAASQNRETATADIKGAYLEAKMKTKVFMKMDKTISTLFVKIFPEYKRFLVNDELNVQLISALYGCQESALLWFEEIHYFLVNTLKFKQSCNDPCLFYKGDSATATHIAIYVDDLLITATNLRQIQKIEEMMKSRFRDQLWKET